MAVLYNAIDASTELRASAREGKVFDNLVVEERGLGRECSVFRLKMSLSLPAVLVNQNCGGESNLRRRVGLKHVFT